jgi:hypothetical protein
MTKNKLADLNNHLFAQLERLSDENMTPEALEVEVARAGAIVSVADQIVTNAGLQLRAAELFGKFGPSVLPLLPQIGKAE